MGFFGPQDQVGFFDRSRPSVLHQLLVADFHDIHAAGDRRRERLPGKVGNHRLAVGPQITGESPVSIGRYDIGLGRSSEDADVGGQARDQSGAVELVDVMTRQRRRRHLRDWLTFTVAPIVDVGHVGGLCIDATDGDAFPFDEGAKHRARLAS